MKPCQILLVEESAEEAEVLERAARIANEYVSLRLCKNLAEAKSYLRGNGTYADRTHYPFPHLIISDLHVGPDSAFEFLQWIRADERLCAIPVVLLARFSAADSLRRAYALGANAVMSKPVEFDQMLIDIGALFDFWCRVADTPGPVE